MTQDSRTEKPRLYTEAELQAAISAAMVVKPLEWAEGFREFTSAALGDTYCIKVAVNSAVSWRNGHMKPWQLAYDVAQAKVAAQADYQARILSALSIPADAMAALEAVKAQVRDAALEEALAAVSKVFNGFQNHASDAIKSIMGGGE